MEEFQNDVLLFLSRWSGNKTETENLTKLLKREQLKEEDFPEVIKIIHTDNDNLEKIDAKAIAKSLPVIEAAIRQLDK